MCYVLCTQILLFLIQLRHQAISTISSLQTTMLVIIWCYVLLAYHLRQLLLFNVDQYLVCISVIHLKCCLLFQVLCLLVACRRCLQLILTRRWTLVYQLLSLRMTEVSFVIFDLCIRCFTVVAYFFLNILTGVIQSYLTKHQTVGLMYCNVLTLTSVH